MAAKKASPVLGIDFGTSYSCVGVFKDNKVEIIQNGQGNTITPNVVAFNDTAKTMVGEEARNHAVRNFDSTIFDVKRLIGRKFADQSVQSDKELWPFKVIDQDNNPKVQIRQAGKLKTYSPEEVTSMIFSKLKESAEDCLKMDVSDAIITVPPYFDDSQRQAMKHAGALAGLNILQILNEPTAATIAYGYEKDVPEERNVLVFDLGSRTCVVSLIMIEDGIFETKITSQDTQSGGEAFTNRLVEHFSAEFKHKSGTDLSNDKTAMYRLRIAAEKGKYVLSSRDQASIEVEDLFQDFDLRTSINRGEFEHLCEDLFQKCMQQVQHVLQEAKIDKSTIEKVVLVGGSTRIPKITELLQIFFSGKILQDVNPDEVIAHGAAKFGFILASKGPATSCCLGTELSLGVETSDGFMETVIPRHSQIPCRASRIFTVSNPTSASIRVYEGARPLANYNHKVGVLQLSDFASAPFPKINVTFDIDANGILRVTAEIIGSSLSSSVDFDFNVRPSKDDVKRMLNDSEQHKAEDEAVRQKVAMRTGIKVLP